MTTANNVAASLFFVAAILGDALTALEDAAPLAAPPARRGSAAVLVGALASPIVYNPRSGVYGALQRPVLGTILVLVALLGAHEAEAWLRVSDATYVGIVGAAMVGLFGRRRRSPGEGHLQQR